MFKIRLTARAIYNETSVVNIHAGSNIDMVPKIKGNYFFRVEIDKSQTFSMI